MTTTPGEKRAGTGDGHAERGAIPHDTFASRLVMVRMHHGYLTIEQAAAKCGVNYGSWSNWERGMNPRDILGVAQKISDGLGIDYEWLLFGSQRRAPGARGDHSFTYGGVPISRPPASRPPARMSNTGPRGSRRPRRLTPPIMAKLAE